MKNTIMILMIGSLMMSCSNKNSNGMDEIQEEAQELVNEVKEQSEEEWKAMKSELEAKQSELNEEITTLSYKIKNKADDINMELERERDSLVMLQNKIEKKLKYQMSEASEDWEAFKSETNEFIKELKE